MGVLFARADTEIIVTMLRIQALCWTHRGERTPALRASELVQLIAIPRSNFYRHLEKLTQMQWIRIDKIGRQMIIRPLVRVCQAEAGQGAAAAPPAWRPPQPAQPTASERAPARRCPGTGRKPPASAVAHDAPSIRRRLPGPATEAEPAAATVDPQLMAALSDAGILEPKLSELARAGVDPLDVLAWRLWARAPQRRNMTNPTGAVIRRLERREPPPAEYRLQAERGGTWGERPVYRPSTAPEAPADEPGPASEAELELQVAADQWDGIRDALALKLFRETFDDLLNGSRLVEVDGDRWTVEVVHPLAADSLNRRPPIVIQKVIRRTIGRDIDITYVGRPVGPLHAHGGSACGA